MTEYCIDTSALIDGWKDYPPEHFGVWDEIQKKKIKESGDVLLSNKEKLIS
ncbi:MAG: hypothetical protein LBM96_06550 [Methanobrevibacter sp.]|jgi:hypothetical protein|nr:hypothetical protein [Candidatus Methanoflexus mossambicus]